jgi:hypothetical protein
MFWFCQKTAVEIPIQHYHKFAARTGLRYNVHFRHTSVSLLLGAVAYAFILPLLQLGIFVFCASLVVIKSEAREISKIVISMTVNDYSLEGIKYHYVNSKLLAALSVDKARTGSENKCSYDLAPNYYPHLKLHAMQANTPSVTKAECLILLREAIYTTEFTSEEVMRKIKQVSPAVKDSKSVNDRADIHQLLVGSFSVNSFVPSVASVTANDYSNVTHESFYSWLRLQRTNGNMLFWSSLPSETAMLESLKFPITIKPPPIGFSEINLKSFSSISLSPESLIVLVERFCTSCSADALESAIAIYRDCAKARLELLTEKNCEVIDVWGVEQWVIYYRDNSDKDASRISFGILRAISNRSNKTLSDLCEGRDVLHSVRGVACLNLTRQ